MYKSRLSPWATTWLLLSLVFILIIFLIYFFLFFPRENYVTVVAQSKDGKYEIKLKYFDYGGSFGSCGVGYGKGNAMLKYYLGSGCGGTVIHPFIIKKGIINSFFELEALPEKVACSSEGGICSTVAIEELEPFELHDKQTIFWYGEEIKFK